MSRSGALTLPEIQVIMRHRDLAVTGGYLNPRLEDMVAALAAHYATPPQQRQPAPSMGYDPADLAVVFGEVVFGE